MQVKTFTGATTQGVMAQVKAEMGPDAVILSNRTFRRNGEVFHEITAGIERHEAEQATTEAGSDECWGEWRKDWMQIKDQLFALMKPAIQLERLTPRQRVALEYLQREGVDDAVSLDLYKRLLAKPGSSVLECLGDMVSVRPFSLAAWPQHLHLLVGPYGAGKTATALRLALCLRKADPGVKVAFINADCMRGNGRVMLKHWAELSNIAHVEAADSGAMEQALRKTAGFDVVFIDVPGLSRGRSLEGWREAMGLTDGKAAVHLLLSPFCDALQTQEFLSRYKSGGPSSIIWTKLDEAVSFGNIVNVACKAALPVSAFSFGTDLQESLVPATEALVWRLVFKRQIPGHEAGSKSIRSSR